MSGSEYTACDGNYMAKILKDSISPDGVRLTTLIIRLPRIMLSELNTHRRFSRNSASSRAMPTERLIEAVRENPFIPATFNKRVKGMGIGEELDSSKTVVSRHQWLGARDQSVFAAEQLVKIGVDKSRANRLLEPFLWHTAIISSTEWENFFGLRCPPGHVPDIDFPAQWEIQQIAILMRDAMADSKPQELQYGEWHIPLIHSISVAGVEKYAGPDATVDDRWQILKKVAARQLARVSFDTHTQTEPTDVSVAKAEELADSAHFSPFEHVARPMHLDDLTGDFQNSIMVPAYIAVGYDFPVNYWAVDHLWCGNFRGWIQMRKEFPYEDNHLRALQAASNA